MAISTISSAREHTSTDTWLVVASACLLSGLAIADRTVAWMLGEFPTSAALWELRFEYLRPIGVFHDIAVQHFGDVGVGSFNIAAAMIALLVALGALSRIRLVRAVACHILLAAALVVAIYSMDPGEGIYARVGVPSDGYVLIGLLVTMAAAFMCVSAHCEYVGWNPASSRVARRVQIATARLRSRLVARGVEVLDRTLPTVGKAQLILVRARRGNRMSSVA